MNSISVQVITKTNNKLIFCIQNIDGLALSEHLGWTTLGFEFETVFFIPPNNL